jgi:hypothetical protein
MPRHAQFVHPAPPHWSVPELVKIVSVIAPLKFKTACEIATTATTLNTDEIKPTASSHLIKSGVPCVINAELLIMHALEARTWLGNALSLRAKDSHQPSTADATTRPARY